MIRTDIRKHTRVNIRGREINFRRYLAKATAISALSLLLSILSFGQTPASIKGSIADKNGGKISGADVRLRSRTGAQTNTTTDTNGTFEFRSLPPGQYLIEVRAQGFAQFASDLDEDTKARIESGRRYVELLKQPQNNPMPFYKQVVSIYAANAGMYSLVPVSDVRKTEDSFLEFIERDQKEIFDTIETGRELTPEVLAKIDAAIETFKATLA